LRIKLLSFALRAKLKRKKEAPRRASAPKVEDRRLRRGASFASTAILLLGKNMVKKEYGKRDTTRAEPHGKKGKTAGP
jgi:hypothetical protein